MQNQLIDHTIPTGQWTFDESVTDVFDNMLSRSIPQYQTMRELCFLLGSEFVKKNSDVLDIGCSRGEALAPFVDRFGSRHRFIGLEVSQPMIEAARSRFKGYIDVGIVDIKEWDLRRGLPNVSASLILSIFTLQFVPLEYRQGLLRSIYQSLISGIF